MDGAEEPANGGCACGSGWRYTGVANSTGGITSGRARPAGTSKSAARAAAGVLFASEIGGALGMILWLRIRASLPAKMATRTSWRVWVPVTKTGSRVPVGGGWRRYWVGAATHNLKIEIQRERRT